MYVEEFDAHASQESGSALRQLEADLLGLETSEASASAAAKAAKDTLASHERRARLLERALTDDQKAQSAKKVELEKVP